MTKNKVRMHDVDMAGRLYFIKQFRFAHDALEDFVDSEGFSFNNLFENEDFLLVIVHTESDYFLPVQIGDRVRTHVSVTAIGTTSFTLHYAFYKEPDLLFGVAKTVHVSIDKLTEQKIPIPPHFLPMLETHFNDKPVTR